MDLEVSYDITYLEKISNQDKDFIKEMLETFVINTPVYFNDIEKYYQEKNFELLYKAVHKFIPTLAFVCAKKNIDRFEELERLALTKADNKELHDLIVKLKIFCSQLVEQIKIDFKL